MSEKELAGLFIMGALFALYGGFFWRLRDPIEEGEKSWQTRTGVEIGAPYFCVVGAAVALFGGVGWLLAQFAR